MMKPEQKSRVDLEQISLGCNGPWLIDPRVYPAPPFEGSQCGSTWSRSSRRRASRTTFRRLATAFFLVRDIFPRGRRPLSGGGSRQRRVGRGSPPSEVPRGAGEGREGGRGTELRDAPRDCFFLLLVLCPRLPYLDARPRRSTSPRSY